MKAKKIELPQSEEFQNLINLLAVYSEASNRLANLQSVANDHLLEVMDDIKPEYAKLQETLTQAEAAMEIIALKHPAWFTSKKSIKTPYGTVALRRSTELKIENEEASRVRLELEATRRFPGDSVEAIKARAEFLARYIRVTESLNKEALEAEEDAFLAPLRITRVTKENFSAKPAALEMGKAISETNSQETRA